MDRVTRSIQLRHGFGVALRLPPGHEKGKPHQPDLQRSIVRDAMRAFETIARPERNRGAALRMGSERSNVGGDRLHPGLHARASEPWSRRPDRSSTHRGVPQAIAWSVERYKALRFRAVLSGSRCNVNRRTLEDRYRRHYAAAARIARPTNRRNPCPHFF